MQAGKAPERKPCPPPRLPLPVGRGAGRGCFGATRAAAGQEKF